MVFHNKERQCCVLFAFQNVKLIVIPASPEASAQSVKVGFTYTVESALKSALMGWKPTTTQWSALVLVSPAPHKGPALPGLLMGMGDLWRARAARSVRAQGKDSSNPPRKYSASQGTTNSHHFIKIKLGCAPKYSSDAKGSSASGKKAHFILLTWPALR